VRTVNTVPDHGSPSGHPNESVLAGYLDGDLSGEAVAELESHLEACAECRELLAGAAAVLADGTSPGESTTAGTVLPRARRPARALRFAGFAMAASIATILVVRAAGIGADHPDDRAQMRRPGNDVGEGLPAIVVYSPAANASVSRAALRFTWSQSAAERFHLVVANEEGTPLFETDTRDTALVLPDSVGLQAGHLYFWHADAVGGGLIASTRLQRFTISAVP
jgi:Putative zinc-finger